MKITSKILTALVTCLLMNSASHAVAVYTETLYWDGGDNDGKAAGACTFILPDGKPFSQTKTLVVEENLPVGSVIYSWNYNNFLSGRFSSSCSASGVSNSTSKITTPNASGTDISLNVSMAGSTGTPPWYTNTKNPGVAIQYTYAFFSDAEPCSECLPTFNSGRKAVTIFNSQHATSGLESGKERYQDFITSYHNVTLLATDGRYYFAYSPDGQATSQAFAIKADLIKTGPVTYDGSPLSCEYNSCGLQVYAGSVFGTYNYDIGAGGITLVRPACQLSTTDYLIPMGKWGAGTTMSPVYGNQVPVSLALECSGQVDHVRFRFEDTGPSTSGTQNVSLYDSASGTKVDGLEIELLYQGGKVPVDNTTLTDTGSHGTPKIMPDALPLFDSGSSVPFQARYVQSGKVTRSGIDYTGPVTGKVNLYVTYD